MASSTFRPIYYLGCKNEFAAEIVSAIDSVDPSKGALGDLFAGTGAVAASVSMSRSVLTADVQEYSRVLCSAVLAPARLDAPQIDKLIAQSRSCDSFHLKKWCFDPMISFENHALAKALEGFPNELLDLIESQPLAAASSNTSDAPEALSVARLGTIQRLKASGLWDSPDTTVSRLFGGAYFSFAQSIALDSLLSTANSLGIGRDTLVAAALSTASSLVNTVGKQFAQPIRPKNKSGELKQGLIATVQRDRSRDAFDTYEIWLRKYVKLPGSRFVPTTLRQDFLTAISERSTELSVLYADPPYTRDHYSRFYHVLETMCLRDNPAYTTVVKRGKKSISRGLYRVDRYQSDFCIRSSAPAAFEALFKSSREADLPLVVSYSPHEAGDGTHPRVVSMNQIIEIANANYKRVQVVSIDGSSHNNLNRTGLQLKEREHAEVLILCHR